MIQNNSPSPLEVGRVLKNTLVLYRSHLKSYLGITLRSQLWNSAIFLVFLGFTGLTLLLFGILGSISSEGTSLNLIQGLLAFFLMVVLIISLFYSSFFCAGKSLMNLALISRLAYQELANQPELPPTARQQISTRHWQFFGVQFLVGLLLFGINMGLQILQTLVILPTSVIFGSESTIAVFITSVLGLASSLLSFWFYAHWFIPKVPLAVEDNLTSTSAIERSWNLSKRNVIQIFLIIIVASVITIPLYLLVMFLALAPAIPAILVAIQTADWSTLETQSSLLVSILSIIPAFLLVIVLFIIVDFFILPFWQVMKGVIYYQLRSVES